MQDFEELKKAKQRCVDELVEALPRYIERLDEIDHRLVEYIEDALINNASHANLYELLGIRKELRLMDSYDHRVRELWNMVVHSNFKEDQNPLIKEMNGKVKELKEQGKI